jgi:glycosyltransferase involved in cell wall biosynthesis
MRLLFVHERFGALGGAESNACITAEELGKRGHSVGLLHGPGTGKDERHWTDIFPTRYPLGTNGKEVACAALASFQPDLVYVHKMAELGVIEALTESGRALVRMVHDHDIYCMKSYRYSYFSRKICTRAIGPYCVIPCGAFLARNRQGPLPIKYVSYRAKQKEVRLNQQFHRLIVVSEYMRQELLRNGFDPAAIEIHPPVPRMQQDGVRSSFSDRNLVVFAGQIIRGKGVDLLLRALALVKYPFECVILGEGSHRPACERLSRKLGLSNRVVFRGFVPQPELKNFYAECSAIAVSSVWPEPIATIGLEAMRHGLPVVAFNAGGIADWLKDGENGFLVPWKDHVQFAARLEELLRNKELARKMGQRGSELAQQHFAFDQYIADLEQMFATVVVEHHQTGKCTSATA